MRNFLLFTVMTLAISCVSHVKHEIEDTAGYPVDTAPVDTDTAADTGTTDTVDTGA